MKIGNGFFGNVADFQYLETAVRNQNSIQEEIKRGRNSCYSFCRSAQKLLFLEYEEYNFACGSVWVRNLVSGIERKTEGL
jgi:hypothetical protein